METLQKVIALFGALWKGYQANDAESILQSSCLLIKTIAEVTPAAVDDKLHEFAHSALTIPVVHDYVIELIERMLPGNPVLLSGAFVEPIPAGVAAAGGTAEVIAMLVKIIAAILDAFGEPDVVIHTTRGE